jgi:hypothetical protein
MKEYIRATHNFDNITREWTYRGDRGQEKFDEWSNPETRGKTVFKEEDTKWSLGVHALRRDEWMSMDWIIWETIRAFKGDAGGNYREFEKFLADNPDHQKIIQQHIENEFKILIPLDMVQVRERPW